MQHDPKKARAQHPEHVPSPPTQITFLSREFTRRLPLLGYFPRAQIIIASNSVESEREGGGREGMDWEFGVSRCKQTITYRMDGQQGPTVEHREL